MRPEESTKFLPDNSLAPLAATRRMTPQAKVLRWRKPWDTVWDRQKKESKNLLAPKTEGELIGG